MAGYDWLWSLYVIIAKEKLCPTFWAVTKLKIGIEEYVAKLRAARKPGDDAELSVAELTTVLDERKPWLRQIKDSMIFVVNPPCALTGGHAGIADKVSTEAYKMHLGTEPEEHLSDEATTYRSNTADMGVEIGLARFRLADDKTAEHLLPPWLERRELGPDLEEEVEPSDLPELEESDGSALPLDVEYGDRGEVPNSPPPRLPQPARAPVRFGGEYLPKCHTLAGLEHLANNLNSDVNHSMSHFKAVFSDLKQLEALLGSYRKKTFVWTCIRKTRYAKYEAQFLNFNGSLYEQRWHEVVSFIKKVRRLIIIVTLTFSSERFLSGLDRDGLAEQSSVAATRLRKEKTAGRSDFDPHKLEKALGGAFFHFYIFMIERLDSVPTEFAKDNAICACHRALLHGLGSYRTRLVLQAHYGPGVNMCPMSCKNLPELIDEGVEEAMNEQKAIMEDEIKVFCPPPNVRPMTDRDWEDIFDDFRQGFRASLMLLNVKTDYVHRLPVSIGGLAVASEERALHHAIKVRAAFQRDPRKEVHDPRTWELLAPGCPFVIELDKFIEHAGRVKRCELSLYFQEEVAVFRFIFVNETAAEERHAIAAVDLRRHYLGPVRMSLSNRMPMVQRSLKYGFVSGMDLLRCFSAARSLLKVPDILGLSNHPSLKLFSRVGDKVRPAEMRVAVCKVLYRCDLIDMFSSQARVAKAHLAQKRKEADPQLKYILI
jgi:hypothetical protein